MKKKISVLLLALLCFALALPMLTPSAKAADLDEILRYEITVDVNDDATLRMRYHVDWKVLDSTSEGPLSWAKIGIPNSHYISMTALSPAVRKLSYLSDGGSYVRVDLDRDYHAGEVADIEFEIVQDYMYVVNELTEGETVYHLTPGWFTDARVDDMTLRWNADKAISQSPSCLVEDGYYVWSQPLAKNEKISVNVTYPTDAFAFDVSKSANEESEDSFEDWFFIVIGAIVFIAFVAGPILMVIIGVIVSFNRTANFSSGTEKKVTRTKIVYYPECQGCGAPRPEGKDNCEFCGRSFIKSEEVIKEEDIPKEEKDLRGKNTDGLYRYSSQPNTYMRVHVTHVPIVVPRSSYSSSSRGGGSHHSSCAHSSCACACACACAGGGRAGCTTKDFYNTGLKLRQLMKKHEAKNK